MAELTAERDCLPPSRQDRRRLTCRRCIVVQRSLHQHYLLPEAGQPQISSTGLRKPERNRRANESAERGAVNSWNSGKQESKNTLNEFNGIGNRSSSILQLQI